MFWQTIWHLRGKNINTTVTIKTQSVAILNNEEEILSRLKECFKNHLNPVTLTPWTLVSCN